MARLQALAFRTHKPLQTRPPTLQPFDPPTSVGHPTISTVNPTLPPSPPPASKMRWSRTVVQPLKEEAMKKLLAICFAGSLLTLGAAWAQDAAQTDTMKKTDTMSDTKAKARQGHGQNQR